MNWHGFQAEEFLFEGRKAIIVFPVNPDKEKNWAFKMEYWDAFPEMELMLLERGYHLAFIENKCRWALDFDMVMKARFAFYLSETYGLRNKCVPIGMSAGGAQAINFAGMYPELISCLLLEAPVVDLASCPGKGCDGPGVWENEVEPIFPHLTRENAARFSGNPINRLNKLIQNNIPAVLVYGDEDTIVLWQENSAKVIDAYKEKPELLIVMLRKGQGHHPHGFLDKSGPIIDNIIKIAR